MATIAFDTFENVKRLKAVGFTEKQAEVQTKIFSELVENRLATKQDIVLLQRDMKEMEVSLKRDMKEMELKITSEQKLIKWMMGFVLAG
ncbi:MAG: hypothetical protein B6240_12550, partial [Desulfobacteraceae bacterium 4572_87]